MLAILLTLLLAAAPFWEAKGPTAWSEDELNQLLGFSHEGKALTPVDGRLDELVDRSIRTVKALPEFEGAPGHDLLVWEGTITAISSSAPNCLSKSETSVPSSP